MRKQAFDWQEFAGNAARQALAQIGDLKQIRERPFEILFKYLTPGLLLLKGKWILAALFGVAEDVLGIGPSMIGAWIDRMIGKGAGSGNTEPVPEAGLMEAAKSVVDRISGGLFSESSAFRAEVERRGVVDMGALVVAWAHGPDRIERRAASLESKVRGWLAMSPYKSKGFFSGALFALLKALLVGVGVHAGVGMLFGGSKAPPMGEPAGRAPDQRSTGMRLYTNPMGSVERSLAMALDNLVRDDGGRPFSEIFAELKGYGPVGSPEMDRVLATVRAAHGGASIHEINGYRTFAAPPLAEIAKTLLPQATYSRRAGKPKTGPTGFDAERELESILGGKK